MITFIGLGWQVMSINLFSNVGNLAPYKEDDFEDLRENPSQQGEAYAYQSSSQLLATLLSTLKSKPTFLGQDGHSSSIPLDFAWLLTIPTMSNWDDLCSDGKLRELTLG